MPRSKLRQSKSSVKRGGIDAFVPESKWRRPTQSLKTSKQRSFPLLDLPPEILDTVLFYVIEIPWHPSHATFPSQAIKNLFPASVLQTNHSLRTRSVQIITHKCLWIRIDFLWKSTWDWFDGLESTVPNLPPVYREILPPKLPGVRFVLGTPRASTRETRSFSTEKTSLVFPFNYHSFAAFYGRMVDMRWRLRFVTIELFDLPAHMRKLVDVQVLSSVQLLRAHTDVSIIKPTGEVDDLKSDLSLASDVTRRIDELMSMVLALDAQNRVLEGSILCMYCGRFLCWIALLSGTISDWVRDPGELTAPDWLHNPDNLERMRLVRILYYIESRSFHGYFRGFHDYGFAFVKAHYSDLVRLVRRSYTARHRWVDLPSYFFFGLPDHEMAAIYHMQALTISHNRECIEYCLKNLPEDQNLLDVFQANYSGLYEAAYYALRAWNMDMKNLQYASTLNDLVQTQPFLLNTIRRQISDSSSPIYAQLNRDTQQRISRSELEYVSRAKQLAWSVEVAYDQRREADMPQREVGDENLTAAKRLFRDGISQKEAGQYQGTPSLKPVLDWKAVGMNEKDVLDAHVSRRHDVSAPWHCWKTM